MIIEGNIRKRTADRAKKLDKVSSYPFWNWMEITTLRQVLGEIDAVKRNAPSVSDEMSEKNMEEIIRKKPGHERNSPTAGQGLNAVGVEYAALRAAYSILPFVVAEHYTIL
jgi:hypothetical protein